MTANMNQLVFFRRRSTGAAVVAAAGLLMSSTVLGQDRGPDPTPPPLHPDVLLAMMAAWGECKGPCPADLNGDGMVDSTDIALAVTGEVYVPVHQLAPHLPVSGPEFRTCRTEPDPSVVIIRPKSSQGGGMAGNGWDGPGQGAATVYWYIENNTPDFGAGQRQALIDGMQVWANVVQITFREICLPNRNVAVDWAYRTLDHSAFEPAEAGDPDCPFAGAGGVLAHAGFPPGVNSTCVNPMAETFSGNVHFDEAETWEQDNAGGAGEHNLTLIACHEVGHSIGLTHDTGGGGPHIMRPGFNSNDSMIAPSASDVGHLQGGYASGVGSVVTLNASGVWVDNGFVGTERGNNSINPVNTLIEGVNGVPDFTTGIVVHIQAGSYNETMTITDSMWLRAENGTVTIGN